MEEPTTSDDTRSNRQRQPEAPEAVAKRAQPGETPAPDGQIRRIAPGRRPLFRQ
jgi:hypothetical protein